MSALPLRPVRSFASTIGSLICAMVFAVAVLLSPTETCAEPVNVCGTTGRGVACTTFTPDTGGLWFLGGPGYYEYGARVRVSGFLERSCMAACPGIQGCMVNPVIQTCAVTTCQADFDGSGQAGLQDLFSYLQAYFGNVLGPSPPGADMDQSGAITLQDLFRFLELWFAGC